MVAWSRFNSAIVRESQTWCRKAANPTYNEPQSFRLMLIAGQGFSVTSAWEEILAAELEQTNGYQRPLVVFNSPVFSGGVATLTSSAAEITAVSLSLQFDAIVLVADGSSTANKSVISMTASSDLIEVTNHGLNNGDAVIFTGTGTPSTNVSKDTIYYVRDVMTNTFKVANSVGGSAIDLATDSSGSLTVRYANGWPEMIAIPEITQTIPTGKIGSFVVEWDRQ